MHNPSTLFCSAHTKSFQRIKKNHIIADFLLALILKKFFIDDSGFSHHHHLSLVLWFTILYIKNPWRRCTACTWNFLESDLIPATEVHMFKIHRFSCLLDGVHHPHPCCFPFLFISKIYEKLFCSVIITGLARNAPYIYFASMCQ